MLNFIAYIDPGTGFQYVQNTSSLWGVLAGFFVAAIVPVKMYYKRVALFFSGKSKESS